MKKLYVDSDKDGVPNRWDCQPFNKFKQDTFYHLTERENVNSIKKYGLIPNRDHKKYNIKVFRRDKFFLPKEDKVFVSTLKDGFRIANKTNKALIVFDIPKNEFKNLGYEDYPTADDDVVFSNIPPKHIKEIIMLDEEEENLARRPLSG